MKGLVVLVVLIGVWAGVAVVLRRQGWTAIKRHVLAALCGFIAMICVTAAMMGPGDRKAAGPATEAAAQRAEKLSAADSNAAGKEAKDAKIRKLNRDIVEVDRMDHATPPKIVITLKKNGWDEKAAFHAFVGDAGRILAKATDKRLVDKGTDVVFILRVEITATDGDGGITHSDLNVLQILVPAIDVPAILADTGRPAESALLMRSQVEFNGRIGREMVDDFCSSPMYQGRSGVAPSATFCERALQ